MQVIKRDGTSQPVSFDKITKRIRDLCNGLQHVDPILIAKETINSLYDGISTKELDILSADICASKAHHYPDYNMLGGRILSSNLAKGTSDQYHKVAENLYKASRLSQTFYDFVSSHRDVIQSFFDYSRDLLFDILQSCIESGHFLTILQ